MNDAKIPWQEAKKRIKKSKDVDYKQLHKIAQKFLNDCGLIVSELIFCLFQLLTRESHKAWLNRGSVKNAQVPFFH